jgi:hypothetical protein
MRTNNSIRRFAASALAVAVLGIGATASAQQSVVVAGDDDNDGGSRGPNAFLFNSGLITTGLSYTPALVVAVNSDRSEDKYLYAPFVGPWLDLAARDGEGDKVDRTLLVVDGVFQTIGAIQIIASFMFMEGDDDVASADESPAVVSQTAVAPARLAEDGYGFVAVGRF